VQGISTDLVFTIYTSNTAPIPIIKNEELILLRAEARFFTGDVAGALTDINFIRTNSGGLAPRGPFTGNADFIAELVKQRRYSLRTRPRLAYSPTFRNSDDQRPRPLHVCRRKSGWGRCEKGADFSAPFPFLLVVQLPINEAARRSH